MACTLICFVICEKKYFFIAWYGWAKFVEWYCFVMSRKKRGNYLWRSSV